jgi:hypothetical protein
MYLGIQNEIQGSEWDFPYYKTQLSDPNMRSSKIHS